MAALAYLLPPVSGLVAYLKGRDALVRAHGLQAVAFGALWPGALVVASSAGAGASQAVFSAGAALWIALVIAAALGRTVVLPWLARAAGIRRGS